MSRILSRLPTVKWICASEPWANEVLCCCLSGEYELTALISSVATGALSACSLSMNSTQSIAWLLPCLEFPPPKKIRPLFFFIQSNKVLRKQTEWNQSINLVSRVFTVYIFLGLLVFLIPTKLCSQDSRASVNSHSSKRSHILSTNQFQRSMNHMISVLRTPQSRY